MFEWTDLDLDITQSKTWPCRCVGWETCWQRSKESKSWISSFESLSWGLSKWKLKSSGIIRFLFDLVTEQTSFPTSSWNVASVSLFFFGGGEWYWQTTRTVCFLCDKAKSIFSKNSKLMTENWLWWTSCKSERFLHHGQTPYSGDQQQVEWFLCDVVMDVHRLGAGRLYIEETNLWSGAIKSSSSFSLWFEESDVSCWEGMLKGLIVRWQTGVGQVVKHEAI